VERHVPNRLTRRQLVTPPQRQRADVLDELSVLGVRHERAVDAKRRQVDDVRRTLVVVGPRLVGAERERAAADKDVSACRDLRCPRTRPGEGQRLRHRLAVLELVLRDHSHDEAVAKQWIAVVVRQLRKKREHAFAHLPHVLASGVWGQKRQLPALAARMGKRVIEVVVVRGDRVPPTDAAEQPDLFEVPDVREIPDERRLERRDLSCQQLVRHGCEQRFRSRSRVSESPDELRE
jgi:hypothetical protein